MEYTFKTSDRVEAEIIMAAKKNYNILWNLAHNFLWKFDHLDDDKFSDGVIHVLQKLSEEIEEFREIEE